MFQHQKQHPGLNRIGGVGVDRCKVLTAVAKSALSALFDGNILVCLHVLPRVKHPY